MDLLTIEEASAKGPIKACETSGEAVSDHLPGLRKMIKTGRSVIHALSNKIIS